MYHSTQNRALKPLLRDVSFNLYAHETLALVGESGSGKTITAMSIMNLFRSPLTKIAGGKFYLKVKNLARDAVKRCESFEVKKLPLSRKALLAA